MVFIGSAPNKTFQRTDGVRTGTSVHVTARTNGVNDTAELADAHANDLADAINTSWQTNGDNKPTTNLTMNTKKFTDMAAGSARTDSLRIGQVQDNSFQYAGTVGGTADAITLTLSPAITAYATGMAIDFIAGADNAGATTVNVNSVGVKAIQYNAAALGGGEIKSGMAHKIVYDGTQFQLIAVYAPTFALLASTSNGEGASLIGIEDAAGNFTATDVEAALAEIYTDFASTSSSLGASLIGIEDSAGNFTATDVEGALAEIYTDFASTSSSLGASLIGIEDSAGNFTATDVEGALAEVYTDLASTSSGLGASLIGVEDSNGYFTGTDVEAVLDELYENSGPIIGTEQATTSGSTVTFSGIPSGVKKVTINFVTVSISTNDDFVIQLGNSGGIETTGYNTKSDNSVSGASTSTAGFIVALKNSSNNATGSYMLYLQDSTNHTWCGSSTMFDTGSGGMINSSGYKASMTSELTQLRLLRTGAGSFDAGAVNILYE